MFKFCLHRRSTPPLIQFNSGQSPEGERIWINVVRRRHVRVAWLSHGWPRTSLPFLYPFFFCIQAIKISRMDLVVDLQSACTKRKCTILFIFIIIILLTQRIIAFYRQRKVHSFKVSYETGMLF